MSMMKPGRFIRSLQKNPTILGAILDGVNQERALSVQDGDDGWNVVEIVCHLRDFEAIFFTRARLIVEGNNPTLAPYDQEALAIERDYAAQSLEAALQTYLETRQQFIAWLKAREPDDWQRTGLHPEAGQITLLDQALQVPHHDIDHYEQIARILKQ